jgi:hypothetical protein
LLLQKEVNIVDKNQDFYENARFEPIFFSSNGPIKLKKQVNAEK